MHELQASAEEVKADTYQGKLVVYHGSMSDLIIDIDISKRPPKPTPQTTPPPQNKTKKKTTSQNKTIQIIFDIKNQINKFVRYKYQNI